MEFIHNVVELLETYMVLERPQRIRCFLWLIVHNWLPTNNKKLRWHLMISSASAASFVEVEMAVHMLHDYPLTRNL